MDATGLADVSAVFINLIPVVVGALLATLGGLVGAYTTHYLNVQNTKQQKKADKLELLAEAAFATVDWCSDYLKATLKGISSDTYDHLPPSPVKKAECLVELYFPDIKLDFSQFNAAATDLSHSIASLYVYRIENNGACPDTYMEDDYGPKLRELKNQLESFINKLSLVSQKI
ncbi:hypothetical protein [Thalassolituus sp.]|jgi:hypothetical protein|uniref:hypothetical protein n=1 Tax=Thalassolituus sp. TaxID=2030822 RepID=UPI00260CF363|nr:hypothetical protein [Thalassolituus sp.]MED5440550.1 hypothetical protein [Pseudomonadota bacterium]